MTWKHVTLIVGALGAVVLCGWSAQCSQALSGVVQLATLIIAGTLGNAGVVTAGHRPAHRKEEDK